MSAPDSASSGSPPPPAGKSLLTHHRREDIAPVPEPEGSADSPSLLPEAGDARSVRDRAAELQDPSSSLSGRMASISSLREKGSTPIRPADWRETQKATSTLPQTMARVHRKITAESMRQRISESGGYDAELPSAKSSLRSSLVLADPDPGPLKKLLWMLFAFGHYANGPMLMQPLSAAIGFLLILAGGSVLHLLPFFAPNPLPPTPLTNSLWMLRMTTGGFAAGFLFYLSLSLLLQRLLHRRFGRLGRFYGCKLVANAFLPLGLAQLIVFVISLALRGEGFWRGDLPLFLTSWMRWGFPLLWIWGGLRISQAVCRLFELPVAQMGMLLAGALLLTALSGLFFHEWGFRLVHPRLAGAWEIQRQLGLQSDSDVDLDRLADFERRFALRDSRRRRELYLLRLQENFRRGEVKAARADALRLDYLTPDGSPLDDLAKALNLLFQDRADLALPRLRAAIRHDRDFIPARQWLTLALMESAPAEAELHARELMKADPNPFHLYLLVRLLSPAARHHEIWEAMLQVEAPPEAWLTVTLWQGAAAAEALGNLRRAETLRSVARARTGSDAGEIPGD